MYTQTQVAQSLQRHRYGASQRPRRPVEFRSRGIGLLLWLVSLVVLAVGTPSAVAEEPNPQPARSLEEIEAFIDDEMADHLARFDLAGAVVTVVTDGEVMSKGYGHASAGVSVDAASTMFPTASVAKLFTWTAVMQLVEDGRLDLNADVNDYLSTIQIPDTFDEPVRVWHLLSHTAGFEDRPQVGAYSRTADDLPDLESALLRFMPERAWEPGRFTAYSNYGAALAGQLVAEVSGLSWDDYVATHILEPLEMHHSTASQPVPADLAEHVTDVFVAGERGLEVARFEYSLLAPAGAVASSGQDMGRFMLAHLGGESLDGARLLEESTRRQMHSQLFTHDPRLPGNAHGFWESDENGHRVLSHAGDLNTALTLLALIPDQDLGFYVSYNSPDDSHAAREQLWKAFVDYALPGPASAEMQVVSQPLEPLVGSYAINRVSSTTLSKLLKVLTVVTVTADDGILVTEASGLDAQRWSPVGSNEFQEEGGPGRMIFGLDEIGHVSHVVFNGTSMTEFSPLIAFFPMAWYDSPALHAGLLVLSVVAMLSALLAWPVLALVRRLRGRTQTRTERRARWWAGVTAAMFVPFLVLVVAAVSDFTEIEYGVTPLLWATLILGVVAAAFAVGAVWHAYLAWRAGSWGLAGRLHYTAVALGFLTLVWQLSHWNLLGIHV